MIARYHEATVAGPRGRARGFVEGFLAGRGAPTGSLLDAEEEGLEVESLRERLSEAFHRERETAHLLVEDDLLDLFREAFAAAEAREIGIRLAALRAIEGARFAFALTVYSEEHARRIRRIFEPVPDGVRMEPRDPFRERRDPLARGDAGYAPAHPFELHAEAIVEGEFAHVLPLLRRCRREELIRVRDAVILGRS